MTTKQTLVNEAINASKNAYPSYSNYYVGAALLAKSGKIYCGSNIENASYSVTSCAERNAIFKAVTEGEREWVCLALVTRDGGYPCGACRQVMHEFVPNLSVIIANMQGQIIHELSLEELLPYAFGPANLSLNR